MAIHAFLVTKERSITGVWISPFMLLGFYNPANAWKYPLTSPSRPPAATNPLTSGNSRGRQRQLQLLIFSSVVSVVVTAVLTPVRGLDFVSSTAFILCSFFELF
jgi:hypothetical protein